MKYYCYLATLVACFCLTRSSYAQSGNIPSYYMKDTTVTVDECYFFDEGGPDAGYTGGTKIMTFTSATGHPLCMNIDSLGFADDFDVLEVFDGNSVDAPLLGAISSGKIEGFPWAYKATGPSLTFRFKASFWKPETGKGWATHIYTYNANPQEAKLDMVWTGLRSGSMDTTDYDRDGDPDIISGGAVFRNDTRKDSIFLFKDRVLTSIGNWQNCNAESADFDGDGDMDVFITGETGGINVITTRLYFNNGNGTFTPSTQTFTPVTQGDLKLLDYNKDGRIDISYTGLSSSPGNYIFRLYLNNGNGLFTEQPVNVPVTDNSSLDWADVEGDGDMDLLFNVRKPGNFIVVNLFINNNNVFTEQDILSDHLIASSVQGDIRFADINGDQKPDITISGQDGGWQVMPIGIYINHGNNTFEQLQHNLPLMYDCELEWKDYDGDGDADLLLTGTNTLQGDWYSVGVYKNNGNGDFTAFNLPNSGYSHVRWGDINADGKQDVLVLNQYEHSYIAKNMGSDSFAVVTFPLPLMSQNGDGLISDFDGDRIPDLLLAGILADLNEDYNNNSYFRAGAGMKYQWIPKFTMVADLLLDTNPPGTENPVYQWADYDNDGLADIIVHDPRGEALKAYKNQGNDTFKCVYASAKPAGYNLFVRGAAMADLDNDGKNELVVAPNIVSRWDGNDFTLLYNEGQERPIDEWYLLALADYDDDGYKDLALWSDGIVEIFKNDRTGKLVSLDKRYEMRPVNHANFIKWADLDNDGDLDIATSDGMLENHGNNNFEYRTGPPQYASAAVADLNGDYLPDIFTQGRTYYSQGPNYFYKDITYPAARHDAYAGSMISLDVDKDGDQDIICGTDRYPKALLLNNSNFATGIQLPQPAITGLKSSYCEATGVATGRITNLPPAAYKANITVKLDGTILTTTADGSFTFDLYSLGSGSHLLKVTVTAQKASPMSEEVTFTLDKAVTPQVDVTANMTTIIALGQPLVLTAANIAGGGDNPMYAFASDKAFTKILQKDSNAVTLTMLPQLLKIGANKLFVRMRSSEQCYNSLTAIDSITIIRDIATGILDPVAEDKTVQPFPNPFRDKVYLKGLSPLYTYTLTLQDLQGRVLYSTRLINPSNPSLSFPVNPGIYLLTIYDEHNKSLLTTLKLVKTE